VAQLACVGVEADRILAAARAEAGFGRPRPSLSNL
jgi:hypothetical protein